MKVLTIIGARPQFIKSAPVSLAIRKLGYNEYVVHTGQHYDYGMSQIFFDELEIPQPDVNLGIGSGFHGQQTGKMLIALEEVIQAQKPDWVLVYGDTNSTLAGALAAVKLHVPLAHIEAGLRSYNREMPEEHNRVLTDHCADLLFCPTETAVNNLTKEGITQGVYLVGDTMYDAVLQFAEIARQRSHILQNLRIEPKKYLLATVHRPHNTDNLNNLRRIVESLIETNETVIFPVHPRTQAHFDKFGFTQFYSQCQNLRFIEPVGYLDMLMLEQHARIILTDSGGVQKEAYFFGVPCITLRPETEWVETVAAGWNVIVGTDPIRIHAGVKSYSWPEVTPVPVFGTGDAGRQIVTRLLDHKYHKQTNLEC
jgi:UDP-GlcNAc3NAcA epimerase